jgi:hypothetical protein
MGGKVNTFILPENVSRGVGRVHSEAYPLTTTIQDIAQVINQLPMRLDTSSTSGKSLGIF